MLTRIARIDFGLPVILVVTLFGLGCGSADEGSGRAGGEGTAASQASSRCLELVKAGRFAESVDACSEALRESPTSEQIAAALALAKQGVADSAEQAADAARQAARQAEQAAEAASEQAAEIAEAAEDKADEIAEAAEEKTDEAAAQAESQRAAAEQAAGSLQDDVDALGR